MSKEAMKLALGVLRPPYCDAPLEDVIKALEEALAKQEQGEPDWKALVLNHNADCESRCDMDKCGYKPYFEYSKRRCPNCPVHETIDIEYTTPQQRTWVGLTDEEIYQVTQDRTWMHTEGLCRAIEAKLKEKNT
jgi:hypothetical protein